MKWKWVDCAKEMGGLCKADNKWSLRAKSGSQEKRNDYKDNQEQVGGMKSDTTQTGIAKKGLSCSGMTGRVILQWKNAV